MYNKEIPNLSISIIVISHDDIGHAIVSAATKTFGELPIPTTVVNIAMDTDPEDLLPKLQQLIDSINTETGILLLTDLFGATPSNIASTLQQTLHVRLVSGLNLPMLMRVMNYPDATLDELAEKAITGGREGVIDVDNPPSCSDDK